MTIVDHGDILEGAIVPAQESDGIAVNPAAPLRYFSEGGATISPRDARRFGSSGHSTSSRGCWAESRRSRYEDPSF